MREQKEIDNAVTIFNDMESTEKVRAILDVLENDWDDMEIEDRYFDENDPWVEQAALSARQFLDGEIEIEDVE